MTTVLFDLGGVILTNGWDHRERGLAAAKFGLDAAELERRHAPMIEPLETGAISLPDYLDQVIFDRPRPFSKADFLAFAESCSQPLPDSLAVVAGLAEAGRARLAVVNNESRELNQYRITAFGLARYFSAFCSSCYLGARKPGVEIFQRALGVLQAEARDSLFVDDREENLAAPRSLGVATLLFSTAAELRRECRERGLL